MYLVISSPTVGSGRGPGSAPSEDPDGDDESLRLPELPDGARDSPGDASGSAGTPDPNGSSPCSVCGGTGAAPP
jgi:hypothetical protein